MSTIDQGRSRHGRGPFSSCDGGAPKTLRPILEASILKDAGLFADASSLSTKVGATFADYPMTVRSAKEPVRGFVRTITVEGCSSVFKRGMTGVYPHCGKQHLRRYLAEYWYNNCVKLSCSDVKRALRGIVEKRLTYRTVGA